MRWKSIHPHLDIPTNVTTWEWIFESPKHSSVLTSTRENVGGYIDAITKERLDFFQVKEDATALSTALIKSHGMQPGDTVSLFSTNTIWYPVAMWATVRAGGRVNGASPAYNVDEMCHCLKTAKSRFLMTLPSSLDVAVAACDRVGLPRKNIFLLQGKHEDYRSIQDLIWSASHTPPNVPYSIPEGQDNRQVCGFLNFSSGTTGLPKAVMLSHHNIIAQCQQLRQLQVLSDDGRYRILAVMPLFHITGLVRFCNYPAYMNGDCIMLPSFSMEGMLRAIVDFEVPELILVPPIIIRLVRDPVVDKYLPHLQRIVRRWSSGSAPTAPEIIELLRRKFPDTGFRQGYGATESTACISCHPPTHYDYRYAHTGGLLCANTEARVLSLDGAERELGPGETGEICARGPQIAMCYLDNEAATRETFDRDGFLRTGDVGHIDAEGLLHIEDRIKEMIKVKGQQVAPAELEDLLLGHDGVEDVAVLGVPDAYAGERPKAYVVLRAGLPPSEELGRMLLGFVRENKVRYKWLAEIEFTESVPKSSTGKLLRRVLKARDREAERKKGVCVRDGGEQRARL